MQKKTGYIFMVICLFYSLPRLLFFPFNLVIQRGKCEHEVDIVALNLNRAKFSKLLKNHHKSSSSVTFFHSVLSSFQMCRFLSISAEDELVLALSATRAISSKSFQNHLNLFPTLPLCSLACPFSS